VLKKYPEKSIIVIQHDLYICPYQKGYESVFFNLVQKNIIRLRDGFPDLFKKINTIEDTMLYFEEKIKLWNQNKEYAYLIFMNDILIGHFNIKDINWNKSSVELSYWIDVDYEKKGIIYTIISHRKDFIFNQLSISKIFARCDVNNKKSEQVMLKCGMQYEGTLHQNYLSWDNKPIDTYLYSIEKQKY
jgi:ribosomal-protein-alanine N-acetyltransferase